MTARHAHDHGAQIRGAEIRGVAFDSGDTLVRPVGGAWWPGVGFAAAITAHYPGLVWDEAQLAAAITAGIAFLDRVHSTPIQGVDQEREQLCEFYRIVLGRLGCDPSDEDLVADLADRRVTGQVMEPFEDTHSGLARLRARGLVLGVVANAWPSLEGQYRRLGLREFFDAFVISAQLGCCKPDPAIYLEACARLGLAPEDLLFVDNVSDNVAAAQALGFAGLVMARDWPGGARPAGTVTSMYELEAAVRDGAWLRGR